MCVLNQIDRFDLAIDAIDRVPQLQDIGSHAREEFKNSIIRHHQYIRTHGEDMPEITEWTWTAVPSPAERPAENSRNRG
jgi:xylulose-5-phosphate/fructose-6-phosphate phosphoketolase